MARTRHPGAKHSLDALCTRFGVDRTARVKHGALLDAQLLAQVYVELSGGRQIGLSLLAEGGKEEAASNVGRSTLHGGHRPFRSPRPHAASPDELAAHTRFLSAIKEPIWASLTAA